MNILGLTSLPTILDFRYALDSGDLCLAIRFILISKREFFVYDRIEQDNN
jgi:hypothetical protein